MRCDVSLLGLVALLVLLAMAVVLGYPGFWNMARRYWRMGAYELYRSASKAAFVRSLQKLEL